MVTGLWDGWSRVQSQVEILLNSNSIQTGYGVHPSSCSVHRRVPSLGMKWLRNEADHSPCLSVTLKMSKAIHLLPLYAFYSMNRDNFTNTFYTQNHLVSIHPYPKKSHVMPRGAKLRQN